MQSTNMRALVIAGALMALLCSPDQGTAAAARNGKQQAAPPSAGQTISLKQSIMATLEGNKSLRAIQENRVAVEHERDRAVRGYGPRVDVSGGTGGSVLSDTSTRRSNEESSFNTLNRMSATVTQPIWDGFATRSRVRVAESTYDSMTHRVFDNATTLTLDTIIAHVDVLRLRRLLKLAEDNVTEHKRLLELARNRAAAGADTLADVSKAESRLQRAYTSLVEAQAAMLNGQDTYTRLTFNQDYNRLQPVVDAPTPYASVDAVMQEAKTANPKLAAYLQDINAAQGQRELSQSAYYPNVNIEAGPSYQQRGDKEKTWTYNFDVMGVVRWNVFNSGADKAADEAASARVRQSRQTMYNFFDELKLEVQKNWTAIEAAQKQYTFWTKSEELNIITLQAYQEQFLMGQRGLLDLLDAQSELYNSSTQKVTAKNNVLIGHYRLLALSGVLLPRLDVPTERLYAAPSPSTADPGERYR